MTFIYLAMTVLLVIIGYLTYVLHRTQKDVAEAWAALAKLSARVDAIQELTGELTRRTITVGQDHRSVIELIERVTDAVTATALRLRQVEDNLFDEEPTRRVLPATGRTTLLAPSVDIFEQLGED